MIVENRLYPLLGTHFLVTRQAEQLVGTRFLLPTEVSGIEINMGKEKDSFWQKIECFLRSYEKKDVLSVQQSLQLLLPLMPLSRSPFGLRLRTFLCGSLPFGKRLSYGCVAQRLQSSPRGVGQSLAVNPLPLFVPCHRVVQKDQIGGFSGVGGKPRKRASHQEVSSRSRSPLTSFHQGLNTFIEGIPSL